MNVLLPRVVSELDADGRKRLRVLSAAEVPKELRPLWVSRFSPPLASEGATKDEHDEPAFEVFEAQRQRWLALRQRVGLSQRDLAERLGISPALVAMVEQGTRRSVATLTRGIRELEQLLRTEP